MVRGFRLTKATMLILILTFVFAVAAAAGDPPPAPAAPQKAPSPAAPPTAQAQPAAVPAGEAPEMVLKETEFDAGNVNKGDLIKHDFAVENKGKGTLEITHVQPACGCTVTEFDKQIAPGKSGKITATVNTSNFSGPIQKTISVTTNDAKLANFQLTIKATVKSILNVEPSEYQQLGLVFKGQPMEKVFTLKSED